MDSSKRPYAAALIVDLAGLLIFFGLTVYNASANTVIPGLSLRWEFYSTLLVFFRWLPLLNFLAFCFALGTLRGKAEPSRAMLPAAVISIIYACLVLIFEPGIDLQKTNLEQSSQRFNNAVTLCRDSIKNGQAREARKALSQAKAIDPGDERLIGLESEVDGAEIKAAAAALAQTVPAEAPVEETRAAGSGREFLQKAQEYFARRDYFSAYWYAAEALKISPKLTDAKELADAAWNELNGPSADPDAQARGDFYKRKFEAYGRLRAADYSEAYRLFNALSKEKANDPDVERYLAESKSGLQSIAFFRDEAARALAAKAYSRFFMVLHPDGTKAGHIIVIAADEASFTPSAAFFSGIEYLDSAGSSGAAAGAVQTAGSRPGLRIKTEMAKLTGGRLLFTAVDRGNPERGQHPLFVSIGLSPEDASLVALSRAAPSSLDIAQLFSAIRRLPLFGLDTSVLLLELLRRLGEPFALLSAAVLGLLLGTRFKIRGSRLPKGAWLGMILISAVSALIYVAADRVDILISRCIEAHFEGLPALMGISAGVRFLFLIIVVLLTASLGSSSESAGPDGNAPEDF